MKIWRLFPWLWIVGLFLFVACNPAGEKAKETDLTRSVKHAMGTTDVVHHPKRVVVLDNGALDNLLALKVKPIGAATVFEKAPFFSYLKDQPKGIKSIGTIDQPNLEAIASLKPDLILGTKEAHEGIYDQLSEIAPTVFTKDYGIDWKENFRLHAKAVNKEKEMDTQLDEFEKRSAQLKKQLKEKPEKTEISLLRPRTDHIRIYLRQSFSGKFVEDLGFSRPKPQQKDEFELQATEENMETLDGDVILWFTRDQDNLLEEKIMKSPLWKDLKAVKQDRVHHVSDETWLSGMGIQAANAMLDDLFKVFEEK